MMKNLRKNAIIITSIFGEIMNARVSGLIRYIGKRLLQGIPMVLAVIILCFVIIQLAPGDPITLMTIGYTPTEEMRAALEATWGLDQPLLAQLWNYLRRMLTGDLGYSYVQATSVSEVLAGRLPKTFLLMFTALTLSTIIGTLAGIYCSRRMYSVGDNVIRVVALIGYSAPMFWIAEVLILVFAVGLGWFPVSGMISLRGNFVGFRKVLDVMYHMVLPVVTLSFWFSAMMIRITRTKMADVLQNDYIKTAVAKGASDQQVTFRHAFRNAMAPLVTVLGMEFGSMFMGACVIETIFAWPGTGKLMYNAVCQRDYNLVTGLFFVISISVIVVNIVVDIIYAILDPQVRYE